METVRMQASNTVATNSGNSATTSSSNSTATDNANFTKTLVQVLQSGTAAESNSTSAALTGTLMPGLLIGTAETSQEQLPNTAEALLQLLAQLLNGAQNQENSSDSDPDAAGNVDTSALAQLQLLLLQWTSAQPDASANPEAATMTSGSTVEASQPRNASVQQLLQALEVIGEQQTKQSGSTQPSFQELLTVLKPLLTEVSATVSNQVATVAAQASSNTAVVAVQSQPQVVRGDSHLPLTRKSGKEQSTGSVSGAQPLVQIVSDPRSTSGLSWLAAKAVLQAPVTPVAVSSSTAALGTEVDVPVEVTAGQAESKDSTQGQAVFRMPTSSETIVKGDTPVVSANRFAQEMSQLMKSMNLQSTNGHSEIKITLMPDHLGQVDVKMSMQNGHLVAQFVADSLHGKDLLESQLPQLRAVLQSQGLQVDRLEVTQGQEAAFAMFQEQQKQQSSQQFKRKQQGESNDGDETPIDFDAELATLAARRAALAGSSFDVTA